MAIEKNWTRRRFLQASGVATGAKTAMGSTRPAASTNTSPGALEPAKSLGSPMGANDTVRLGLIGSGSQGVKDLVRCLEAPKTTAVAICDVDESQLRKATKKIGSSVDTYGDFRRLLDRKDIDAVIVGTPDHWHAIPTLEAIRAGKDVYLEKPIGHTIREGQRLVEVASQHDRIVEVGLQQRSGTIFQKAVELVRSGHIGKVSRVHCINAWNVMPSGGTGRSRPMDNLPDEPTPAGIDYDMWLGPAPKRPFNRNRLHSNFIYYWDYSGGMVVAWGVHLLDIVLWAVNDMPTGVTTSGGMFVVEDPRETPDTAEVLYDFPNLTVTYSCRHATAFATGSPRADHGIQFLGDKATLLVDRAGYQIIPEGEKAEPIGSDEKLDDGLGRHQRSFVESVRSRRAPVCSIEEGHKATTLCHLANISYLTGRKIAWDPEKEQILSDADASRYLSKEYRAPWSLG